MLTSPITLVEDATEQQKVHGQLIPSPDEAISMYRLNGGSITDPEECTADPLFDDVEKTEIRFQSFNLL